MITRYTHNNLTWIDLESPTETEVKEVMDHYKIHPLVAEELLIPSTKAKVESHKKYLYLILHFPSLKKGGKIEPSKEVDFIIGKNYIVTSRFAVIEPIVNFSKTFEVHSILGKETIGDHAGYIFYYMMKKLYRDISGQLEHIEERLSTIEEHIFAGREREMVQELSTYSRELLDFKQVLSPHRQTLESLKPFANELFGDQFAHFVNAIEGEYGKIMGEISANKEFLTDLRDTNDSLLTTKQNETMKLFTILAFVTFPLSLVIAILTIHSPSNPLDGHPQEFWIIVVFTVVMSFVMFGYFRHKKWL